VTPTRIRLATVLVAIALGAAGCGNSEDVPSASKRTLTVLAASSLTGTFTDLAEQFEGSHPGVQVKLVFDSSATLAQQAVEHAPGDVLATADQKTMDQARTGGGIKGDPVEFATNVIALAVPKDNPANIAAVSDLDRHGVDYLTCVTTAPCGAAAQALLQQDHITRKPVSQEVDVKSVLAKVESGEADAGLVYQTDVTAAAGKVTGLAVPGAADNPNTYWVAATAGTKDPELADQWIAYLTGAEGQAVLKTAGFGTIG
jgi:molybdate transport system substrate-binding protein